MWLSADVLSYEIRDIRTDQTFEVQNFGKNGGPTIKPYGWSCDCDRKGCEHIQRAVLYKRNLDDMRTKVSTASTESIVVRSGLKRKIRLQ